MSTALATITIDDLDVALHQIRDMLNVDDLLEVRAKVEAARAWAKVHRRVEEARKQLLAIEVETLVRIWELDEGKCLDPSLRSAAKFFAEMTIEERQTTLIERGKSTTAAGIYRAIRVEQRADEERERGRNWARRPTVEDAPTPDVLKVLGDAIDALVGAGEPFTVEEMADAVIEATGSTGEPFEQGARWMCREALRSARPSEIDGTIIPRTLTVATPEGGYMRVPTMNATVGHATAAVAMRQEQLDNYTAALQRLDKFRTKVDALAGGDQSAVIGDLLSHITQETK